MQAISNQIAIAIRIQRTVLHVTEVSTHEKLSVVGLVTLPLHTSETAVAILLTLLRTTTATIITWLSRNDRCFIREASTQVTLGKQTCLTATKC